MEVLWSYGCSSAERGSERISVETNDIDDMQRVYVIGDIHGRADLLDKMIEDIIHSAACEIMRNNVLINVHMTDAAAQAGVPRCFFSSSVCIYRDMAPGEPEMTEEGASPALPDNEYGWEKLYSERSAMTYGRRCGMVVVRIVRFQNCYGPEGAWQGGREKAPAAICRKVAQAPDGGEIEVWGSGDAVRSYIYVDDMVDGVCRLMHSDLEGPANIGNREYVTANVRPAHRRAFKQMFDSHQSSGARQDLHARTRAKSTLFSASNH
ncbi:MAG: NAD-dependent epimerase/dehydratase family protein [Bradyrhizobium sp.]